VWVLRHAKAVADPPAGGSDHDRSLAPRGRRDAEALGRRLGQGDRFGLGPDELPATVVSSSAQRTLQTAELVLDAWGSDVALEVSDGLYRASTRDVVEELASVDGARHSVMVVGHNPTAHALCFELLSSSDSDGFAVLEETGFPTCALAVFAVPWRRWAEAEEGTGTLLGLFTPPY
jgi:phosphohistidine phosphatase